MQQKQIQMVWHEVTCPTESVRLGMLAEGIWYAHYAPIVGAGQIAHMMAGVHGASAVREWVVDPMTTVGVLVHPQRKSWCGYMVLCHGCPDPGSCLLSKFYLVPSLRRKGHGCQALMHAVSEAAGRGAGRLWLTVNRKNDPARMAYAGMGFTCVGTQVAEIGGGYVMDDEVWELPLSLPPSPGISEGFTISTVGKAS